MQATNYIFPYFCFILYKLLSHTLYLIQKMLIGDKIRKFRGLKGLSQENMAEALKMSLLAYGDIERDKKDISLKRLDQIAKILGISAVGILILR
jgi:DNA-binding XRE family transcriptional regulator